MLATRCPRCGANNPVSLAHPGHYECAQCRYAGPPSDEARPIIESAARVLRSMDARTFQLTEIQGRMLASARSLRGLYLLLFAALVVPAVLATGMVESFTAEVGWPAPLLLALPGAIVIAAGLGGVVALRRRHEELLLRCTADAPRGRGEVGRCHVCGAPLESGASELVARCRFCRADNIISPDAIRRVRRRHDAAAVGFERGLARKQRALTRATAHAAGAVGLGALVLIALVVCKAWNLQSVVARLNRAGAEYWLVPTERGTCIGRRTLPTDRFTFGDAPADGLHTEVESDGEVRLVATRLVGRRVRADGGRTGRVQDVRLVSGDVHAVIDLGEGRISRTVLGLCLGSD